MPYRLFRARAGARLTQAVPCLREVRAQSAVYDALQVRAAYHFSPPRRHLIYQPDSK